MSGGSSRRQMRVAETLKMEISQILQSEIRDPRIGFVTVTNAEISPDLQLATVYVQVLGGEKERKDTLIGLKQAAPHIRNVLASRIELRRVPNLRFVYDEGQDNYERIEKLLKGISDDTD